MAKRLVVGFFLLAVAGVFGFLEYHSYQERTEPASWTPVPATIEHIEVYKKDGSSGRSRDYRVSLRYRYEVDGVEYVGRRFRVEQRWTSRGDAEDAIRGLESGTRTTCYVAPYASGISILQVGPAFSIALVLLTVAPALAGIWVILGCPGLMLLYARPDRIPRARARRL